ncbi:SpoIIE family protein phosphatase [Cellulomonas sp. NPDC055163]
MVSPGARGDDGHEAVPDPALLLGELAIEAAGIGTYDWDLRTGRIRWDARMLEIFGHDESTFDQTFRGFQSRVHPHDRGMVESLLDEAITACSDFEMQYRVVLEDRTTRWVAARGRVLPGPDGTAGRVLGAAYDATERQDGEARVARILEAIPTAFFSVGADWRFTYVNAEAERLLGRAREEMLGGDLWELFPAAVGSEFERNYRGAAASGEAVVFDAHYPAPLDAWYEVRAWPGLDGLAVYFLDITERRRAQESAENAVARAALTAAVTSSLAETLDAEEAVARLAQLVVPALADWCVVTLIEDDESRGPRRRLRDVGSWHVDPQARALAARYSEVRLSALADSSFLLRALGTGEVVDVPHGATEAVRGVLAPGEAHDLVGRLAPESATVLPLRGRGRTVGAVSLFNGAGRGRIGDEDRATAVEVAGRAGLALDNARLYRRQRQVAEELQRSLLTAPPEPDHVQIVVRYEPAAEAAKVGGDWYDAFLQPDGATVLVIGDIVGHDITAAAAMGQVRSILRGIAVATGAGPGELVTKVDRALRTLQVETLATAVVARIEQTDDERARGVTHLRWSNAGHPAPMVVNPDGTVLVLSGLGPDMLLGVQPDSRRTESEVALDRGSTVLLYTDGLVERRDRGLKEGMALLRDTLEEVAALGLGLDELCDEVVRRMLPSRPGDDVALVAVRLHRQDRPRPAEAGPNVVPPDVPDTPEITPLPG